MKPAEREAAVCGLTTVGRPYPSGGPHTHTHMDSVNRTQWIVVNSLKRHEVGRELCWGLLSGDETTETEDGYDQNTLCTVIFKK